MNRDFTEIAKAFDAGYRCGLAESERQAGWVIFAVMICTMLGGAVGALMTWLFE